MTPLEELMSLQNCDKATMERVAELAAAIRKAALEEAAQVCEAMREELGDSDPRKFAYYMAAAAIRALSGPAPS